MSSPLALPSAEQIENGVAVVTHKDERWLNCQIKSVSLLGNVLMKQFAVENHAAETIMFRDEMLSEGSSTNIWLVKNHTLIAPVRNNLILEGIRYGYLAELAKREGIGFEMRSIAKAEVLAADELMLTSATREVLAITQVDGNKIGHGKPGPVFKKLYAAYQQDKAAL
jgi:D-alanine transaminase